MDQRKTRLKQDGTEPTLPSLLVSVWSTQESWLRFSWRNLRNTMNVEVTSE